MMDILDHAQRIEELHREQALKNRFKAVHESFIHCQDCGEEIPPQRRQMIVGCTRCVSCQQQHEAKIKHFRR